MSFDRLLAADAPPIVAILRGVRPDEVVEIGEALVDSGIRLIEVPLNSPDPLNSVERLAKALGDRALVGAGTVLTVADVEAVAGVGGRMIVSPNVQPEVIARTVALGLESLPGFVTPSEAFAAIAAGTRRLKLFPAGALGPGHLKAVREVLPKGVETWAVGGAGAGNLREWLDAGAAGFGIGGSLYRAGRSVDEVSAIARELVTAWRTATAPR